MAKYMTVEEALASMQAKVNENGKKQINRFNKKNFNTLMTAMANDLDFTEKVAKVKKGEVEIEDVMVTKGFRKWCKNLVEKAGIDKSESERIMNADFTIDNVDGLYDFFAAALYEYMDAGNRFDLPSKEDFQGSIEIKEVAESVKQAEARSPQDGTILGVFETTKKAHKEMKVKSSCPSYLSSRKKVEQ